AIAKDYFGEENIELGDFVIGSSGTLRQAMIAKQYDFGLYAFVHIPIARLAGSPFKSVIELHDQEIFGIVVRTQLRDQVKAVKDPALHLVTREDVLATKPDLVKRMVNVQKKGLDFIRGNSASAIADLIMGNTTSAAQFQGFDRSLVTKVIDHIKSGFGTGCI